jgi:DNA segregation ATPase FtsK/SpoIIIE-like protein
MPDHNLLSGPGTIEQRLLENIRLVEQIQAAEQIPRANINAALPGLPPAERKLIEETLRQISTYQRNFDVHKLAALTQDRVADALDPRRVKARTSSKPGTSGGVAPTGGPGGVDVGGGGGTSGAPSTGGSLTRKDFDRRFGEAILAGDHEAAQAMSEELQRAIGNPSPQDDKGIKRLSIGDQEFVFHIDEKLLSFVRGFCTADRFGGKLRSKEGALRAAIDRLEIAEDVYRYHPGQSPTGEPSTSINDLIALFDTHFPDLDLHDALRTYIARREDLLPFVDVLTVDPFAAISPNHLDLFENYLSAAGRLMDLISSRYDDMHEASDVSLQICLSQLLALDTVLVKCTLKGQETLKAILMPLNPMYLWMFVELVKIGERIRRDPECTEEDRRAFLNEMTQERYFLNTLYLGEYITDKDTVTLPLAGGIELLPCYENTSNHYSGLDGLDQLFGVLRHFSAQYRTLARPLRVAIVDVPSVDKVLDRIDALLREIKRRDLPYLHLELYFTTTGAARNYLSSMLSPENEQVYQGLIASGRLQLFLKNDDLPLKEIVTTLIDAPVHLLALFDQSNVLQRSFTRTVDFNTSPLCITRDFKHDVFRDQITVRPVTNAPLFSAYDDFVRRLKNEVAKHTTGVVADASALKTIIEQALRDEATQWLFLADRALPPESNLQAARLLSQPANRRQTLTLAHSFDPFARPLKELLDDFNLYVPTELALISLMQDFAHLISEGLLALNNRYGVFDKNRQKGLLGMLLAARDYRRRYPESIIVSIDSSTARQWLRISSESGGERRADLLGLRMEGENFFLDAIEVKTHVGLPFDEANNPEDDTLANAQDQIAKTIGALRRVFVSSQTEPPLVAPRREVLRELFHQEIQSRRYSKDFRLLWVPRLKELFVSQMVDRVRIQGYVYEIALSKDIEIRERPLNNDPVNPQTLRIIGTNHIQTLLDAPDDSTLTQPAITDEIRRVVTEGLVEHAQTVLVETTASIPAHAEPPQPPEPVPTQSPTIIPNVINTAAPTTEDSGDDETWLKRTAAAYERASGNFGIQVVECDINDAVIGPSVVRFRFRLAEGQSRRKLDQNLDDIGREMSLSSILVRSLPDSKYLALDVPSPKRRISSLLHDGLTQLPPITTVDQLPLVIGQSPTGEVLVKDLREMAHLLVGGSTRSGKTMFLYSAILSLLARHPAKESLELILCTTKPEDFVFFEHLPHLYGRTIIDDASKAIEEIQRVYSETLIERSKILTQYRVRSAEEYNQERAIAEQIRPIVIIVDEFADLGDQVSDDRKAREEFYTSIRKIAQTGRNRSIHLILCTQRPTADLLPSNVKAQMNARVALKVNSALDSRIILDQDGAEQLLGRGDMLFKEASIFERVQGYLISRKEIDEFLISLRS